MRVLGVWRHLLSPDIKIVSRVVAAALLLLLLQISPSASGATPERRQALIELDPAHTQINFILKGFPHTTTGSFKMKRGEIRIDPQTGAADGSIIIDAASGTTGIGMRDSEMKNSILEVQRYPEIVFVPQQATGHPVAQGDFAAVVSGTLLLHGARHEVTLNLMIHRNSGDFAAATHFTIPYVQWGMKNPTVLFLTVADEVQVDVSTVGRVTWIPASN